MMYLAIKEVSKIEFYTKTTFEFFHFCLKFQLIN